MTPAQAAAERVEAYLHARELWYTTAPDAIDQRGGAPLTASDLRALVVTAWGGEVAGDG